MSKPRGTVPTGPTVTARYAVKIINGVACSVARRSAWNRKTVEAAHFYPGFSRR